jgi:hypothetical protein
VNESERLTGKYAQRIAMLATMVERDKWEANLLELRHDILDIMNKTSGTVLCDSVIKRIDEILEKRRCSEPKTTTSST